MAVERWGRQRQKTMKAFRPLKYIDCLIWSRPASWYAAYPIWWYFYLAAAITQPNFTGLMSRLTGNRSQTWWPSCSERLKTETLRAWWMETKIVDFHRFVNSLLHYPEDGATNRVTLNHWKNLSFTGARIPFKRPELLADVQINGPRTRGGRWAGQVGQVGVVLPETCVCLIWCFT